MNVPFPSLPQESQQQWELYVKDPNAWFDYQIRKMSKALKENNFFPDDNFFEDICFKEKSKEFHPNFLKRSFPFWLKNVKNILKQQNVNEKSWFNQVGFENLNFTHALVLLPLFKMYEALS